MAAIYAYRELLNKLHDAIHKAAGKLIEENKELVNSLKKRNLLEIIEGEK